MRRSFWNRFLMPAPDRAPAPIWTEQFQVELPGDLSQWDFVGDFELSPVSDGAPLSMYERSQFFEWARDVCARCTHTYNPQEWVQAQAHANQALAAGRTGCGLPRPVHAEVRLTVPPGIESIAREAHEARVRLDMDGARLRSLDKAVFSDARLAYLWWLDTEPDRLQDLAGLDAFLKAIPSRRDVTVEPRYAWLSLADQFVSGLDQAGLSYLVTNIAKIFRHFERPDLADRLGDLYDDAVDGRENPPAGQ